MSTVEMKALLEAGVQFGHKSSFWNPSMAPYIYAVHENMHIIDLRKTKPMMEAALAFLHQVAERGGTTLFVGTKRAARDIIEEEAKRAQVPFVVHRWLGGTLTNYKTIRKSIKRRDDIDVRLRDAGPNALIKKERLMLMRALAKLNENLSGIAKMNGLPDALFVVDVGQEKNAIKEANKLGIPVVGIVDSNYSMEGIDYPIPGNDDASMSIALYARLAADAVLSGREKAMAEAAKSGAASSDQVVKKAVLSPRRSASASTETVKITRQGASAVEEAVVNTAAKAGVSKKTSAAKQAKTSSDRQSK